jgi:hypothetical protein
MYGVGGEVIAPGALVVSAPYTGPVNSAGAAVLDPTDPAGGYTGLGGRRRRSRKTAKKGRKGRKGTRKMKGGATPGMVSMGTVGYGYGGGGTVTSGPPDATQYTQRGNAY